MFDPATGKFTLTIDLDHEAVLKVERSHDLKDWIVLPVPHYVPGTYTYTFELGDPGQASAYFRITTLDQ